MPLPTIPEYDVQVHDARFGGFVHYATEIGAIKNYSFKSFRLFQIALQAKGGYEKEFYSCTVPLLRPRSNLSIALSVEISISDGKLQ